MGCWSNDLVRSARAFLHYSRGRSAAPLVIPSGKRQSGSDRGISLRHLEVNLRGRSLVEQACRLPV